MLPPEIKKQIQRIQIHTNRMANDLLQGSYHSAFKGHGMEFEQVREYFPGDDVRHIDWNVTARMDEPYVKEFIEEREITVMLLVDISASGNFGSKVRFKKEVLAEFAAVMASSAIKNNDKVGVILFSDQVEKYIPPRKGKAHVWNVIQSILTHEPQHRQTQVRAGLEHLNQVVKRRSIVFVLSDFVSEPFEKALQLANKRHDLVAVCVSDPAEQQLPPLGILTLQDPETAEVIQIDTKNPRLQEEYAQKHQWQQQSLQQLFEKIGVDTLWVEPNQPYLHNLIHLLQNRGRRR